MVFLLLSEEKLFCADSISHHWGEWREGVDWSHCQSNNILQAYNLIQLVCIASTKLEEAGGDPSLGNTSYPSILMPQSLDPGLVVLYNNITAVINVLVLLSCLTAWLAVCKVIKCLRPLGKTNVPQLVPTLPDPQVSQTLNISSSQSQLSTLT